MSASEDPSEPPPAVFATTKWTRVLSARGDSSDAKAALSDLCAAYYAPVFAFIRRNSPDEDSARDFTQEFFARLLGRQGIDSVDPRRGRFRSYLLGAVKHFLADSRDRALRQKRGAGTAHEPIDSSSDTPAPQIPDPSAPSPDREFDRKWALTLLDRAFKTLAREHADKPEQFELLKSWLTGDAGEMSQSEAARQLGMTEGAVKVAIHRLRRRFREVIKGEIAQTVDNSAQVETELKDLLAALTA
jgi:RNA polymerase sigma factor (sigma-70 family)